MSENKSAAAKEMEAGLAAITENWSDVTAKTMAMLADFTKQSGAATTTAKDPFNMGGAFMDLATRLMADPSKLVEAQTAMWNDYIHLWQDAGRRTAGEDVPDRIEQAKGDKRFRSDDWRENQFFDFARQSYLLASRHFMKAVHELNGVTAEEATRLDFYGRQFVDAMSPSNFLATNPDVLRETVETKGQNLVNGLQNLLKDMERGDGKLDIAMTDYDAFEVGGNLATTPGSVVFQNEMLQLIQYDPTTEKVHKTPLLIFPSWINKFYILDLKPENSFVRWAVSEGFTVFVVSWVNPDGSHRDTSFADYMEKGALAALDAVESATGEKSIHTIGYCIAGTLLSSTLAYLEATGDADRIKSATFFTTQIDFTEAGEMLVFIDAEQVDVLEKDMVEKGYLDGKSMALSFNMLRSNDLIWSFVVNNYLMGRKPKAFDLLFWNSDSTNLPLAMHGYCLRNFYLNNKLVEPGGIVLNGVPIDLTSIKVPTYIQAGAVDHIAPPNSVYKLTRHFSGKNRFVLAGSGHIAGVVNPPSAKKYQHWLNEDMTAETLDDWRQGAEEHPGSWWPDWSKWLKSQGKAKVTARTPGDGDLTVIEAAPGSYVRVKSG